MDAPPLTVLIVEDVPEDRLTMRRLLARAAPTGYTFLEASRGDQALAAVQASLPDCVLLDQRLPDMDGLALLAALRAVTDVPVVLLTSAGNEALAVAALQQGAQEYLPKGTLTPERLHLSIQRAIATARLVRERDQARALLTAMLNTLPVGVAALDVELRILQPNPALADLLGRPAAALRGQLLLDHWPEHAASLAAARAQVLRTGQPAGPLDLVVAGPEPGAPVRTWQASLHPLALADGPAPGFCLVVQEVTALAQANATLHAGEQRLRLALDAAKSSVWEWDVAAGTFTYIAQETLPIGLPPGQLSCTIDEMIAAVYPPDRPALAQTIAAALTEGGAYQFQLRMFGPAGQLHWI
ncbi:MAG: response regulator, partial [Chloroflexales bacterium]|nr:response regulator [Chloroflexales bacterium]